MTSRVQKGGQIFKPLAKPRAGARPSATPGPSQSLARNASTPAPPSQSRKGAPEPLIHSVEEPEPYFLTPAQTQIPVIVSSSQQQVVPPVSHPIPIPQPEPIPLPTPAPTQILISQPIAVPLPAPTPATAIPIPIPIPAPPQPLHTTNANVPKPPAIVSTTDDTDKPPPASARRRKPNEKDGTEAPKNPKRKRKSTSDDTTTTTTTTPDDDDDSISPPPTVEPRSQNRRRRTQSRKSKTPTPGFDPTAPPGEDIDPTVVTMASLCYDTGQGRVSSKAEEVMRNHAEWKKQNRDKRARMKMLMERKKYGLPEEEENNGTGKEKGKEGEKFENDKDGEGEVVVVEDNTENAQAGPSNTANDTANGKDDFDYGDLQRSRFNVQVRIGPNGETIIDEQSLTVDRVEGDVEEEASGYERVVESDTTKFVNSGTYGRKLRGSRWSREETDLFFDALAQYGENYELISYVLPGRDRKQCKNKFKAEDKKNPARIDACLRMRVPVDMQTLSRMTGKDFSGPTPIIAMPTPPPPPPPPQLPHTDASSSQIQQERGREKEKKKGKKSNSRSRSRHVEEDGVEVLGDVDAFGDVFGDGEGKD